jgi:hypothetical protein
VGERERLAGDGGIGGVNQDLRSGGMILAIGSSSQLCSVSTYPLVVDDLDNDGGLALGGTVIDEEDTADLDEAI